MQQIKSTRLYDMDISNYIKELISQSSMFKGNIFKSMIKEEDIRSDIVKKYKNFIEDFIDIWEIYSEDLEEKMKRAKGVPNVYTVEYSYVKEFIYSKDDYASILPFTDGVIKGVSSGKFKEPEDIEDFFKFTVQKAFHDRGDSVAALLDKVVSNNIEFDIVNATDNDAKMFDTVKRYPMFNSLSAKELNKAIEKVIDFISTDTPIVIRDLKVNKTRLFISVLNNVIEFITYSLAAYATRIFLISKYAYPFIDNATVTTNSVNESASVDLSDDETAVTIMHDLDELICRDYMKIKEFTDEISSFVKAVGADPLFGANKPKSYKNIMDNYIYNNDDIFTSKLIGNSLYDYISTIETWFCKRNVETITEMNHVLKEFMYNSTQAYETSYSPKQEMLHIIRGSSYDNTLSGYQKLAKDLYIFSGKILGRILLIIDALDEARMKNAEFNTSEINDITENLKMVKELYSELSIAFLYKARDIEMNFNNLKKANINNVKKSLSLDIPGIKNDIDLNNNMMVSIPDTTRIPIDLMDLYDLPTFESLEMYDEYLRALPGFENDSYLTEAGGISSIINAIFSRIKSVFDKFARFVTDKRFEAGRKWVIDHEQKLLSLDYNGKEIYVLPYKKNVTLPDGYNNLIKRLNEFNEDVVKSEDSKKAFIKSLYPSEEIYNWFYGSDTNKSGPEMYRNHILFYDINEVKKDVPVAVTISGATLHDAVGNWITTMRSAPDTLNEFKRIRGEIENAVNNVKSKMVSIENSNKQLNMNDKNSNTPPPTPTASKTPDNNKPEEGEAKPVSVPDTSTGSTTNNSTNAENNKNTGNEALLIEIQTTIMRLWGSLGPIFIHYFITEYKYIKDAYSIGRE